MDREYLPGNVRDRISDLSKEYGIGQNEIARRIGMSEGTFSRFMSGFTDSKQIRWVPKPEKINFSQKSILGISQTLNRVLL